MAHVIDPDRDMPWIEQIEQTCFPPHMRHDPQVYRDFIANEYSAGLLLRCDNRPIGYISGTHLCEDVADEALDKFPEVRAIKDTTFYIDNIAIIEAYRSTIVLDFAIHEQVSLLKREDYRYALAYIRRKYGLSRLMRMRYGARFLERCDDWQGLKEPFDCMLFDIEPIPTLPLAAEYGYLFLRTVREKTHRLVDRRLRPGAPGAQDDSL